MGGLKKYCLISLAFVIAGILLLILLKNNFPSLALSAFDLLGIGFYGFILGLVPVFWPALVVTPVLLVYYDGLFDFVSQFLEVLYACFLGIIIGFTVCSALSVLMFRFVAWLWNRTYVTARKKWYMKNKLNIT